MPSRSSFTLPRPTRSSSRSGSGSSNHNATMAAMMTTTLQRRVQWMMISIIIATTILLMIHPHRISHGLVESHSNRRLRGSWFVEASVRTATMPLTASDSASPSGKATSSKSAESPSVTPTNEQTSSQNASSSTSTGTSSSTASPTNDQTSSKSASSQSAGTWSFSGSPTNEETSSKSAGTSSTSWSGTHSQTEDLTLSKSGSASGSRTHSLTDDRTLSKSGSATKSVRASNSRSSLASESSSASNSNESTSSWTLSATKSNTTSHTVIATRTPSGSMTPSGNESTKSAKLTLTKSLQQTSTDTESKDQTSSLSQNISLTRRLPLTTSETVSDEWTATATETVTGFSDEFTATETWRTLTQSVSKAVPASKTMPATPSRIPCAGWDRNDTLTIMTTTTTLIETIAITNAPMMTVQAISGNYVPLAQDAPVVSGVLPSPIVIAPNSTSTAVLDAVKALVLGVTTTVPVTTAATTTTVVTTLPNVTTTSTTTTRLTTTSTTTAPPVTLSGNVTITATSTTTTTAPKVVKNTTTTGGTAGAILNAVSSMFVPSAYIRVSASLSTLWYARKTMAYTTAILNQTIITETPSNISSCDFEHPLVATAGMSNTGAGDVSSSSFLGVDPQFLIELGNNTNASQNSTSNVTWGPSTSAMTNVTRTWDFVKQNTSRLLVPKSVIVVRRWSPLQLPNATSSSTTGRSGGNSSGNTTGSAEAMWMQQATVLSVDRYDLSTLLKTAESLSSPSSAGSTTGASTTTALSWNTPVIVNQTLRTATTFKTMNQLMFDYRIPSLPSGRSVSVTSLNSGTTTTTNTGNSDGTGSGESSSSSSSSANSVPITNVAIDRAGTWQVESYVEYGLSEDALQQILTIATALSAISSSSASTSSSLSGLLQQLESAILTSKWKYQNDTYGSCWAVVAALPPLDPLMPTAAAGANASTLGYATANRISPTTRLQFALSDQQLAVLSNFDCVTVVVKNNVLWLPKYPLSTLLSSGLPLIESGTQSLSVMLNCVWKSSSSSSSSSSSLMAPDEHTAPPVGVISPSSPPPQLTWGRRGEGSTLTPDLTQSLNRESRRGLYGQGVVALTTTTTAAPTTTVAPGVTAAPAASVSQGIANLIRAVNGTDGAGASTSAGGGTSPVTMLSSLLQSIPSFVSPPIQWSGYVQAYSSTPEFRDVQPGVTDWYWQGGYSLYYSDAVSLTVGIPSTAFLDANRPPPSSVTIWVLITPLNAYLIPNGKIDAVNMPSAWASGVIPPLSLSNWVPAVTGASSLPVTVADSASIYAITTASPDLFVPSSMIQYNINLAPKWTGNRLLLVGGIFVIVIWVIYVLLICCVLVVADGKATINDELVEEAVIVKTVRLPPQVVIVEREPEPPMMEADTEDEMETVPAARRSRKQQQQRQGGGQPRASGSGKRSGRGAAGRRSGEVVLGPDAVRLELPVTRPPPRADPFEEERPPEEPEGRHHERWDDEQTVASSSAATARTNRRNTTNATTTTIGGGSGRPSSSSTTKGGSTSFFGKNRRLVGRKSTTTTSSASSTTTSAAAAAVSKIKIHNQPFEDDDANVSSGEDSERDAIRSAILEASTLRSESSDNDKNKVEMTEEERQQQLQRRLRAYQQPRMTRTDVARYIVVVMEYLAASLSDVMIVITDLIFFSVCLTSVTLQGTAWAAFWVIIQLLTAGGFVLRWRWITAMTRRLGAHGYMPQYIPVLSIFTLYRWRYIDYRRTALSRAFWSGGQRWVSDIPMLILACVFYWWYPRRATEVVAMKILVSSIHILFGIRSVVFFFVRAGVVAAVFFGFQPPLFLDAYVPPQQQQQQQPLPSSPPATIAQQGANGGTTTAPVGTSRNVITMPTTDGTTTGTTAPGATTTAAPPASTLPPLPPGVLLEDLALIDLDDHSSVWSGDEQPEDLLDEAEGGASSLEAPSNGPATEGGDVVGTGTGGGDAPGTMSMINITGINHTPTTTMTSTNPYGRAEQSGSPITLPASPAPSYPFQQAAATTTTNTSAAAAAGNQPTASAGNPFANFGVVGSTNNVFAQPPGRTAAKVVMGNTAGGGGANRNDPFAVFGTGGGGAAAPAAATVTSTAASDRNRYLQLQRQLLLTQLDPVAGSSGMAAQGGAAGSAAAGPRPTTTPEFVDPNELARMAASQDRQSAGMSPGTQQLFMDQF